MATEAIIAVKIVAPITIDAGSTLLDLLDLYRANSTCIYWIYRHANTIFSLQFPCAEFFLVHPMKKYQFSDLACFSILLQRQASPFEKHINNNYTITLAICNTVIDMAVIWPPVEAT